MTAWYLLKLLILLLEIVSSNVHSTVKNDIACCSSIQHKSCIGKYLGVYNIIFWKDLINSSELILRMQKKLAGWKASTLSRGGKLTLIKSNLISMPNHVLSCFRCPAKVTDRLDKECRNFFWGNQSSYKSSYSLETSLYPKRKRRSRSTSWFNNAPLLSLLGKLLLSQITGGLL